MTIKYNEKKRLSYNMDEKAQNINNYDNDNGYDNDDNDYNNNSIQFS
jgi:hypothetical protein